MTARDLKYKLAGVRAWLVEYHQTLPLQTSTDLAVIIGALQVRIEKELKAEEETRIQAEKDADAAYSKP